MNVAHLAKPEPTTSAAPPAAQDGAAPGTLLSRFARARERFGDRPALRFVGQHLSYAELDAASTRAGAGLHGAGVRPGNRVAILMERSPDMIVAMLAVLKAGAAYLPIDPRYPAARIQQTLADAAPALVIVSSGSPHAGTCLRDLVPAESFAPADATPRDTAYVIYTSGSTGVPKGVEVTHGNVVALVQAAESLFHFDQHDVWTMFHSFAFDFSVWEIWGCLFTGGCLVLVPFDLSRSPEDFRALLASESVTVLNQTPSAFALLDRADSAEGLAPLSLRVVIFGGEALNGRALRGWMERHGDQQPQLINMYGITETTVHVTCRRMRLEDADEQESLIGSAIPGWRIHLLDANLQPVADGREGELCVSGVGLAKGYLRRPELTAERFVQNPYGPGRLYRSGDMARVRQDGELVYLGRRDGQVKVNGFRIETAEVEAALLAYPGIVQACVAVRDARLVAYIVSPLPVQISALSATLAAKLPAHMLPARYVPVSRIPLNANGKADRAALPDPPAAAPTAAHGTGTAMQQLVAEVWTSVLAADVSYDDNFFDVGGTSILLVAVRSALSSRLNRAIPVTTLFECTTIRTLASRLEGDVPPNAAAGAGNAERQRQAFARTRAAHAAKGGSR